MSSADGDGVVDMAGSTPDAVGEPGDAGDSPPEAGVDASVDRPDMAGTAHDMGEEPVDMGEEPVDMGEGPVDMGEEPVDMGEEPVDMGEVPAPSGVFELTDVEAKFERLKIQPDVLAWQNDEAAGAIDPSDVEHYQGLARFPGRGTPTLFVTQSRDGGGFLHVVQFGTRDEHGERLRSNLQAVGVDTEDAAPSRDDTWIRSIGFDDRLMIGGERLPAYRHPGAPAIADDVLIVPVDQPVGGQNDAATGLIVLFELRDDPSDPTPLEVLELDHPIDNLAVTRGAADEPFLIWTNGNGGESVYLYRTNGPDLRAEDLSIELVERWTPQGGLIGAEWPTGPSAHQSGAFLRQPGGELYLLAARSGGLIPGTNFWASDHLDLFAFEYAPLEPVTLTFVDTKEVTCAWDAGDDVRDMRVCNFAAASGAHVTPSGELLVYSAPHDDEDGPRIDYVRLGEFRDRDGSQDDSPLRRPWASAGGPYTVQAGERVRLEADAGPYIVGPWIDLYSDVGLRGRSVTIDLEDAMLYEVDDLGRLDGFGDQTRSVRWRAPEGVDLSLYQDETYRGRELILRGTGETEEITNLDAQVIVRGLVEIPNGRVGDPVRFSGIASSLQVPMLPMVQARYTWDLDGDGVFGEQGRDATRGDESGPMVDFDASGLAAPATFPITVHVELDGVAGVLESTSTVDVVAR